MEMGDFCKFAKKSVSMGKIAMFFGRMAAAMVTAGAVVVSAGCARDKPKSPRGLPMRSDFFSAVLSPLR